MGVSSGLAAQAAGLFSCSYVAATWRNIVRVRDMDFDFYNAMCIEHFCDVWYPIFGTDGPGPGISLTPDFDAMMCMGGEL